METLTSYETILKAAQDAHIKPSKLDESVERNFYPVGAIVQGARISGKGNFTHLRIVGTKGLDASVSSLQASAHFGTKETAKFQASKKKGDSFGKIFLTGTNLNQLPADQAKLVANLIGAELLSVEMKTGLVLPYRADDNEKAIFCDTEKEAIKLLSGKDFPKVEFKIA